MYCVHLLPVSCVNEDNTRYKKKAIQMNPQRNCYREKCKKQDLKINFCLDVFLSEEHHFVKKAGPLADCGLRQIRETLDVMSELLNFFLTF